MSTSNYVFFLVMCLLMMSVTGYNIMIGRPEYIAAKGVMAYDEATVEDQCISDCMNKSLTELDITYIAWNKISGNCRCLHTLSRFIEAVDSNYCVELWRPPINSINNELVLGSENDYKVFVTVKEYLGGDDQLNIFLTLDLENFTDSGILQFNSWTNLPKSEINADTGLRTFVPNLITKKDSKVVETFLKTLPYNTINAHYNLFFQLIDIGISDATPAWFVSTFHNHHMVVVDLKRFTVQRPTTPECSAKIITYSNSTQSEYVITYEMETVAPCNVALENITIQVAVQDGLYISNIATKENCIGASKNQIASQNGILKICATIKLKSNLDTKGVTHGVAALTSQYIMFLDGSALMKKETNYTRIDISKEVKVFSMRNEDNGYCIVNDAGSANEQLKPNCERFRLGLHNIKTMNGKCMDMDETTLLVKLVDCNIKKKRISNTQRDIKFNHPTKDYFYKGATTATTAKTTPTNIYKRVYEPSFDLTNNKEGEYDLSNQVTYITILLIESDFIICRPPNRRDNRCIEYSTISSKVKELSPILHGVLGFDPKRSFVYGIDKDGRKILYNRLENSQQLLYTSDDLWKRTLDTPGVILSKNFSMQALYTEIHEDQFTIEAKSYSVSPFGLLDSSTRYPIVIFAPEKSCAAKVGKTQAAALPSCKEIKSFCDAVVSGLFWIGGLLMTEFKQVYCDMTTTYGGWTMIANYTVQNGIRREIAGNYTDDLHDVVSSEFTKYLSSPRGLANTKSYMGFQHLRFYCHSDASDRTLHIETVGVKGSSPALWFMDQIGQPSHHSVLACGSYTIHPDDTSNLGQSCERWGYNPNIASGTGVWGAYGALSNKLYYIPIYISYQYDFRLELAAHLSCDEAGRANEIQNGVWQIFVR